MENINDKNKYKDLVMQALKAKERSYSPYSQFKVGAALMSSAGKVYTGANIESAAYSPTNCAERTAFFKAVFDGERSFEAIAVCGSGNDYCHPCGVCLQVMMEFCNPNRFFVIVIKDADHYNVYTLKQLLPHGFGPADLGANKKGDI